MSDVRGAFAEARAATGFLAGLGPFLHRRPTLSEARHRLDRQLARRAQTFANVLRRAVFERPGSPYQRLFDWAGVTRDQTVAMLADFGLEGTLDRLYDAGIHVTLEEFKGLRPIVRRGLELAVRPEDFDNPLSARHYETETGGSGGLARRIFAGLDLLEHECAYHAQFFAAHGVGERAVAMWLPAPPGAVAMKNALMRAKMGQPVSRWFSQNRPDDASMKHGAFSSATTLVARLCGSKIPRPEYTPAEDVLRVVTWLAEHCRRDTPAVLLTTPSSAVRTCGEADQHGIDIGGSLFVVVGEPYTPARAEVITRAGCRAASHYAMVEAGLIGVACRAASAPDDVHLVSDKVETITRDRSMGGNGRTVPALFHTTLLPASPKIMLNVESGDYGVLEERECGCGVLPRGFRRHLHTIRSYEKLTSEGMHVLGDDLLLLVDRVLPARFGGHPTDYQFVESDDRGVSKVDLIVSPAIGDLDPDAVAHAILEWLRRSGPGEYLMAEVWANSRTLRVVRAHPHLTSGGKLQPLWKAGP